MTQAYIKIKHGSYRNEAVANVVFPLVKQFQVGKKGGFVTVDGTSKFGIGKDKIRIKVAKMTDYDMVGVDEYKATGGQIAAEEAVSTETDEEAMARIKSRFDILHQMTRAACEGNIRAMIVTGPAGVGKSFGVEAELERAALFDRVSGRRVKSEVIKGAATAIGLYQKLYQFSDKDNVLVFDDCDVLFYDDVCLNLLKAALDTSSRRRISWNAESNALKQAGVPDAFDFKGAIIFITNLRFNHINSKRLKDHLLALESRCHFLDLSMNTVRDKLLRIKQVAGDGELFSQYDFSEDQQQEIIDYLFEHAGALGERVDLRTALKVADLYKSFPTKWQEFAAELVMKKQTA